MDGEREKSSIDRLKKKLYSRSGEGLGAQKRRRLREFAYGAKTAWEKEPPAKTFRIDRHVVLKLLLVLSALFFVGSLVLSSFLFFLDRNTISSDNIDVEIQGPSVIGAGEELSLQILITNRNPATLESADLLIEYPEGTRVAGDLSEELLRAREALGDVGPGERIQKTARAVLFGQEGESRTITATIEYRVEGSNAIFYREQAYEVTISDAPIVLSVDSVDELSSNQEVELVATLISNSEMDLHDILLRAEYPFGFTFVDSSPSPFAQTNVWNIGTLEPEEERTVRVRGRILGEDGEERVFRFSAGIVSSVDDTELGTTFVTELQPISIKRPFLGSALAINGDTSPAPVVPRNERIRADITWNNNLPDRIFDAEIEVRLVGDILDERSVTAQNGFYRSSDNTAVWTRETLPTLSTLSTGGRGTVSLSFAALPLALGEAFRTPELALDVTVRGRRVSETNVPEVIESTLRRQIKFETALDLSAQALHDTGPIGNTGPLPPRAEQPTTYTMLWTATNSTNPTGNVNVSATLPSYVRWVGLVQPSNENVSFNEVGGRVMWNIGSMPSYASREVAFQIELIPSLSQVGSEPILINNQHIRGIDTWTTTEVGSAAPSLTTLLRESGFPSGGQYVNE
jgi:hypothetical protein